MSERGIGSYERLREDRRNSSPDERREFIRCLESALPCARAADPIPAEAVPAEPSEAEAGG
jgi:hypothetical protein